MNLIMSHTLDGTAIALIASNLDDRGIIPLLLTQKPRYYVSVCPNNDVTVFTLNSSCVSLFRTYSHFEIVFKLMFSN